MIDLGMTINSNRATVCGEKKLKTLNGRLPLKDSPDFDNCWTELILSTRSFIWDTLCFFQFFSVRAVFGQLPLQQKTLWPLRQNFFTVTNKCLPLRKQIFTVTTKLFAQHDMLKKLVTASSSSRRRFRRCRRCRRRRRRRRHRRRRRRRRRHASSLLRFWKRYAWSAG